MAGDRKGYRFQSTRGGVRIVNDAGEVRVAPGGLSSGDAIRAVGWEVPPDDDDTPAAPPAALPDPPSSPQASATRRLSPARRTPAKPAARKPAARTARK